MVEIKKLRTGDITDYVVERTNYLIQQLFDGKYPNRQHTKEHLRQVVEESIILTAWVDDVMVGMSSIYIVNMVSRVVAFYEELAVDMPYRGTHGIARELDTAAIAYATKAGADAIELVVPYDRPPVQRLHLKRGFGFSGQLSMRMILKRWV